MSAVARVYQAHFERAPTRTLMIANGFLNAVGDLSAQSVQLFVCTPQSPAIFTR